jgi:hypothetical protein
MEASNAHPQCEPTGSTLLRVFRLAFACGAIPACAAVIAAKFGLDWLGLSAILSLGMVGGSLMAEATR